MDKTEECEDYIVYVGRKWVYGRYWDLAGQPYSAAQFWTIPNVDNMLKEIK